MSQITAEQIKKILAEKNPESLVSAEHNDEGHFYRYKPNDRLFASVTTKCGILDAPHLKKWAAKLAVDYLVPELLKFDKLEPDQITKLKEAAVMVHVDEFQEAGNIGTRGHKSIEDYLIEWMKTGERPDDIRKFVTDPDYRCIAIARSAEKFCIDYDVIPLASEMFLASSRHEFAGTMDSLMMVLKQTKKGTQPCNTHMWMQVSTSKPNKKQCFHCHAEGEHVFAIVDWKTSNSIDKVEYAMQVAAYWQALYEMTGLKPKECFIVRIDKHQCKYEVRRLVNRTKAFKAFTHTAKVWEWLNDGQDKLANINQRNNVLLSNVEFKQL